MDSLPLFHRIAGKHVLLLGEGDAADAKARLIERAGGIIVRTASQLSDFDIKLAFVALEDRDEAAEVAAVLRAGGLLVNVVDQPDLCDFTTPSILDRTPVLVAVGTGGASAGLAKALRMRLEALLPQSLGKLANALYQARAAIRQRWPDGVMRRTAIDSALQPGGALDVMYHHASPDDAIRGWLAGDHTDVAIHADHCIRLRSDDVDDLTLRELRWIETADWIIHDPDVPAAILNRSRADAARILHDGASDTSAASGRIVHITR